MAGPTTACGQQPWACENTQEFVELRDAIIDTARSGEFDLAATNLTNAVKRTC